MLGFFIFVSKLKKAMNQIKLLSLVSLFFISISYSQDYNFSISEIPEALLVDANSTVRFENVVIEMDSQRKMTIVTERAITIHNKLADDFADLTLNYDKRRSVKYITAYFYDAAGDKVKKIKKKDFKDYSAYDGISLHNDGRILHYDHTPIAYPYTIYYKYEIETSNTAFINRWVPIRGYYQSIQNASFTINYPTTISLKKSEKNFDGLQIKVEESPGTLTYEMNSMPATKYETSAPLFLDVFPNVKLGVNKFNLEGVDGEANNWSEFGKWYYENLIKQTLNLKEETKQQIKALTANVESPIEKAKLVYEFVQNKVRYISVQVGIGGYKPMLANEVDDLGYGDCKGLTNYTASLLNEVGIEAYHTLVYADDKIDFDAKVVSPEGNHMILYVPISNQDIWLECTSQKRPFAEIGSFTDDRDVLIITPEGGELKHTRVYKVEENLQHTKGMYKIDNQGTITSSVSIESSGTQYGDNLQRYDGASKKELDELFKKYLSHINNVKFSKIEVNNNRKDNKYEENIEFSAVDYATFSGNQMLLPINAFNKNLYVPKRIRNRKLPFEISRGYIDVDEIEIVLPSSFLIEYIPENTNLETQFGSYSIEISKIATHTYSYKRTLQVNAGTYEKEMYEAYRRFRKSIRKYDNSKIILKKQ